MLIVVLALCLGTSVFVALRRRDSLALGLLGMSLSVSVMLCGIIIYIAKMGGVAATERAFLFLSQDLQRSLQFLPVSLNILGYTVALGRTLFPFFLMRIAVETSMTGWIRRRARALRIGSALPTFFFLIYFYPPVFRLLVRGRFWLLAAMLPVSMGWILLDLALAIGLMLWEYRATTIPFFRKNYRYVLLASISITALYLLYATKDPAQIYNLFVGEYIRLGINSYISPSLSGLGWLAIGLCAAFFVILGSYGLIRYAQMDFDENRQELILQRKFDAAGTGISVFVHGIKNQLLSSRVLHKKLSRALACDPPDLGQIQSCAAGLRELNEGMLTRMDELYRTVKNSALSLRPVETSEVVASCVRRFYGKYPEGTLRVVEGTDRLILADPGPLSEAVYNLLINGFEAAVQAGRSRPAVELRTREERLWTVLEIRDNGGGIPIELQAKIYDPFFTSKNTNYNWGMGLYYVRRIVKSHWGRIRLESCEGEGTTFYLMLPLFDAGRKGEKAWRDKNRSP